MISSISGEDEKAIYGAEQDRNDQRFNCKKKPTASIVPNDNNFSMHSFDDQSQSNTPISTSPQSQSGLNFTRTFITGLFNELDNDGTLTFTDVYERYSKLCKTQEINPVNRKLFKREIIACEALCLNESSVCSGVSFVCSVSFSSKLLLLATEQYNLNRSSLSSEERADALRKLASLYMEPERKQEIRGGNYSLQKMIQDVHNCHF